MALASTQAYLATELRGWLWWRRIALPGVFPFYVTGATTASGGSRNAAIVAEVASWGNQRLGAHGLGAYLARATEAGDYHRIVLGIGSHEPDCGDCQPHVLAPALRARGTALPARLTGASHACACPEA